MRPAARIRKYSVSLHGHRTSFSLEEEFHDELRSLAVQRSMALAALIAEVDQHRDEGDNLSSALRVFVLRSLKNGQRAQGDS